MQSQRLSLQWFSLVCLSLLAVVAVPAARAAKPSITKLAPSTAVAGGPAFILTIDGKNFVTGAEVLWGIKQLSTKLKSSTVLTASVPASLIAKKGTANITVKTTGGTSAALRFTILPPKPVISSLSPKTAAAGGPKFTMTILGKNFASTAKVHWAATALTFAYKSPTELLATVPATLIAKAGTANVTVTTTSGTSVAARFTIGPAAPIITAISPTSAIAQGAAFTLTVKGFNFTSGSTAHWAGKALSTKIESLTQLTATVTSDLIASTGTVKVTVSNAKGVSAPAIFTVKPPKPTITSLNPTSATVGGAAFTLTVNGKSFVSGAVVKWGSKALTTSYKSATLVTAAVPSSLLTAAGTINVTVTTPSGTSAPATFQIKPPTPTISSLNPNSTTAGGTDFTLTVNGAGFASGAVVNWNATALPTTFLSSIQLKATVKASLIATAGFPSVTVVSGGITSNSEQFTIASASGPSCANDGTGNAKLNGAYAFQFTQIDPSKGGQSNFNIGVFTADGNGNVMSGLTDSNGAHLSSAVTNTSFTGTYSVGSDDRGLLTLNFGGGVTQTMCFALDSFASGVAGGGHLVSDLSNAEVNSGSFAAQGGSNFTLESAKGSWAVGMQGVKLDSGNGQEVRGATAGYVTLDGSGSVTAGELDTSQDKYVSTTLTNTYKPQVAVTGSYTLASTGRGTISLNLTGGGTNNYVFYVAGAQRIFLLSSDKGGQTGSLVAGGEGLARTATSFNNATLSGSSVFVEQAISNTNSSAYNQRMIEAGIYNWNGTGKYTGTYDQNDAGTISADQSISSQSYAVDSSGRVAINGTSPATFAYLAGPGTGFFVSGNVGVSFGRLENQTPTSGFTAGSFSGNYSQGSLWYLSEAQKVDSGEVASNGSGSLSGNLDVAPLLTGTVDSAPHTPRPNFNRPKPMDVGVSDTYTAAGDGRFVLKQGGTTVRALYIVSADKAYSIDIKDAVWLPIEEFNHQ